MSIGAAVSAAAAVLSNLSTKQRLRHGGIERKVHHLQNLLGSARLPAEHARPEKSVRQQAWQPQSTLAWHAEPHALTLQDGACSACSRLGQATGIGLQMENTPGV